MDTKALKAIGQLAETASVIGDPKKFKAKVDELSGILAETKEIAEQTAAAERSFADRESAIAVREKEIGKKETSIANREAKLRADRASLKNLTKSTDSKSQEIDKLLEEAQQIRDDADRHSAQVNAVIDTRTKELEEFKSLLKEREDVVAAREAKIREIQGV
jgi:DNA repair exonuclease SbcCD ATPase subunit